MNNTLTTQIETVSRECEVPVEVLGVNNLAPQLVRVQVLPVHKILSSGKKGTVTKASTLKTRALTDFAARGLHISGVTLDSDGLWLEMPRPQPQHVPYPRDLELSGKLPIYLGRGVNGQAVTLDLADAPHALVAGATGSGKSVALTTMIYSLASHLPPMDMGLMLIDLKRVEFARFAELPHLLRPPSLNLSQALNTLRFTRAHIDQRYYALSYNPTRKLSHTVLVIDELADLVLQSKEAQGLAIEIGQLGRAAHVHVVAATQRPSADVINGLILVNFLTRIALRVPTRVNSQVILDQSGAENLLGMGDSLLLHHGKLTRFQGAMVSSNQARDLVTYARINEIQRRAAIKPQRVAPNNFLTELVDTITGRSRDQYTTVRMEVVE